MIDGKGGFLVDGRGRVIYSGVLLRVMKKVLMKGCIMGLWWRGGGRC